MFYYTLAIVLVIAVLAVAILSFASRRKSRIRPPSANDTPEAIKRGQYLNK